MGHFIDIIVAGARRTRGYSEKLLLNIRPEQAGRKPHFETSAAATIIDTNHPTWIYGHLALYPAKAMERLGLNAGAAATPNDWTALFDANTVCKDDPKGDLYPRIDVVATQFFKATDIALDAISGLDDAALLRETPDEKMRATFPIVGMGVNFLLNNHVMMHMGQLSAWRRCFGMPSAM